MNFQNIITLIMIVGFLGVIFMVLLADIFVFHEDPGHSDLTIMLIGALVGAIAAYINSLYRK